MARVAMIVWNAFRNDARVRKEAETLQAAGHAVTVFALHAPGLTRRRETLPSGVRVVRVPRSPLRRHRKAPAEGMAPQGSRSHPPQETGLVRQAARVVARAWAHGLILARTVAVRPQVVHGHDVNTLPTAWLASVLLRARLVYDAHEISTDREGYRPLRKAVGWVEKRLMPRAAAAITTTEARARFFARAYGVARPLVLQNRPRYTAVPRTRRIRHELGLSEPWPIVLYQGGLQQGRGLPRLIEAAATVEAAYFVLIGGGRLEGPLREQVLSAGLGERVRFIPTVDLDALPHYTASADIGVQPIENTCLNHFTTDSNKLFEYMMAGLPVVASDLPEIRRIVEGHGFGLTVPPGETAALAAAIGRLVADAALRQRCAARARAAAKCLNWEAQEEGLVSLYADLCAKERCAF